MSKKFIVICFCAFLISISANAKLIELNNFEDNFLSNDENYDIVNKGWMEEIDGIKILHLSGSFYEIGYQLGYFLKYEILKNLRGFGLSETVSKNKTFELWNIQKNYVSNEIIDYINGTADAIGRSFDDVGCMWIWERNCSLHCSSVIAEGSATKSNEIIHVYSLDFPARPVDPITGLCVLDDPILVVAKPDNGYAFMYPTFAGYVVESGVNEMGISLSNTASPCKDENDYGTPIGVRLLDALIKSSNLEEALNILNENRTYGYDILISDLNKNKGYVIEQTANLSVLCRWNDTCESQHPFFQINHIIRRTNCFINSETAATQRTYYNLKDIRYLLHFKFGNLYEWLRFNAISNGYQKYNGDLNLDNALLTHREVYLGKHGGILWYIFRNTYLKEWGSWYQWSYSPKTGDMLICYASRDKWASENPIHHFNFFKLLKKEPPS